MKKKCLTVLTAMCLAVSSLSMPASLGMNVQAEETIKFGTFGEFGYQVLDDGTVKIIKYIGDWEAEKVVIPGEIDGKQVTMIGDEIFDDVIYGASWYLSEIILPNSLTSIGDNAFSGCSGLSEITLPNSLTSIGDNAFSGCSGLSEITLPNGLTSIGDNAFSGCSGLGEITLPNGLTSIGDEAFSGCSGLSEITFPDSLTSIGDKAFFKCNSLKTVELPQGIKSIGYRAFGFNRFGFFSWECKMHDFKLIGYTGTMAQAYADIYGVSFESLGESQSNLYFCEGDFGFVQTSEDTIEIISYLGHSEKVEIPDEINGKKVTGIGDRVFDECFGLSEVKLPNSLTSIGDQAFYNCYKMEIVELPQGIKSIGDLAFGYFMTDGDGMHKNSEFKIYGYDETEAEHYAIRYKFEFIDLSEKPQETPSEDQTEADTTQEATTEENTTVQDTTKDESTTVGNESTTSVSENTTTGESTTEQITSTTESVYVSEKVSLDKSAFTALLEKNQKQDVQIASNDRITFRFAKGSMKEVANMAMYDFTSTVNDKYEELKDSTRKVISKENLAFVVSYNYSGSLPAEAEITIQAGKEYAGKTLYYYLCKEDGSLQFMQEAKVDTDGNMTVTQDHCSDYVVLKTKLPATNTENTEDVKTGDSSPAAPMVFAMAAAMLTVVGMCRKKVKA